MYCCRFMSNHLVRMFFFLYDPPPSEIYTYRHTLSLHDALPICWAASASPAAIWFSAAFIDATTPGAQSSRLCTWLSTVRSEEHTSELQSLMRISYAVFCLKKKKT